MFDPPKWVIEWSLKHSNHKTHQFPPSFYKHVLKKTDFLEILPNENIIQPPGTRAVKTAAKGHVTLIAGCFLNGIILTRHASQGVELPGDRFFPKFFGVFGGLSLVISKSTRWFKVTFLFPCWRSNRRLTIPKRSQRIARRFFYSDVWITSFPNDQGEYSNHRSVPKWKGVWLVFFSNTIYQAKYRQDLWIDLIRCQKKYRCSFLKSQTMTLGRSRIRNLKNLRDVNMNILTINSQPSEDSVVLAVIRFAFTFLGTNS